jgi:hypothetical protein
MHRHIPTPPRVILIRKELTHKIRKSEASLHEHSSLPVLSENNISVIQRTCASHTCPLFPLGCHIETQTALPLRIEHYYIHNRDFEHIFVHL